MSVPESSPTTAATSPAGIGVAVIAGDGAYDMFDVLSVDGEGARVRGPVLLEISEEVPVRITRNGASVDLRARVAGHQRGAGGTITQLVFLGGEAELGRVLGS